MIKTFKLNQQLLKLDNHLSIALSPNQSQYKLALYPSISLIIMNKFYKIIPILKIYIMNNSIFLKKFHPKKLRWVLNFGKEAKLRIKSINRKWSKLKKLELYIKLFLKKKTYLKYLDGKEVSNNFKILWWV